MVGVVSALLSWSLTGCGSKPLNEERVVGGVYSPPTITRSSVLDEQTLQAESSRVAVESVVSLDRSNWPVMPFAVPNALPSHQPVYHSDVHLNLNTARNLSKYPTADSANQTTNYDAQRDQVFEAMLAPAVAAGDIVLFLPRAVYKRPWFVSRSGLQGPDSGAYARGPGRSSSYLPEPVGEPMFPMTKNPPGRAVDEDGAVKGGGAEAPATPTTLPGRPVEVEGGGPFVPAPGPVVEEEPARAATHIGVGDGMGSKPKAGKP